MQDLPVKIKQIVVNLGFRGVDADNPGMEIIHRGKIKSLSRQHKMWLRRRQAVEPAIGHLQNGPLLAARRGGRRAARRQLCRWLQPALAVASRCEFAGGCGSPDARASLKIVLARAPVPNATTIEGVGRGT